MHEESGEQKKETPEPAFQEDGSGPGGEIPESERIAEESDPGDSAAERTLTTSSLSDGELRSIVEVLLLVSDRPISVSQIRDVLDAQSPQKIDEIIGQVQEHLSEHGFPFQVRSVATGYVLSTLPEYAPYIRKFYAPKMKSSKLSQAALETLAVIAYKQPVTRAEIEAIRGVNVDSTLKTLLEKRFVEIVGYKDVVGKPATYGTTNEFLLQFGLKALSELPSIEELRNSKPDK